MIDEINETIAAIGGTWLKLNRKEHGTIEGDIVDVDIRDRRDPQGDPVLSRKTGEPRKEWVVTLTVDPDKRDGHEDDGTRKLSLNESAQRAFGLAVKSTGHPLEKGGRIKIAVQADPEDSYKQAEYIARYTPPTKKIDLPDTSSGAGGDDFDF